MLLDSDGGVEQTTFMYKLKRTFHQNWPYFLLIYFLNVTSYDVGIQNVFIIAYENSITFSTFETTSAITKAMWAGRKKNIISRLNCI